MIRNKNKIQRKTYTITEQISYVEKYKELKKIYQKRGYLFISEELDISKNCLKEWILQSEDFKELKYKTKTFLLKGGWKNPQTIEIENELIKWLEELRKLDICFTSPELFYKAKELDNTLEKKYFNALNCWFYDFLKRYSYSIRRTAHLGQKLRDNKL